IGFGLRWLSSEMRVPYPPARMTTFMPKPASTKSAAHLAGVPAVHWSIFSAIATIAVPMWGSQALPANPK
ncbi:hypothetical protein, partial [Sinorhizobium fredii]|uniref:hypothetical protein n=1 Tax=Rhizobium fredii TaxID=380 RepID=UPI001AEC4C7D